MRLIDADKLVMHLADFALSMSGKTEYFTIQQCIKAVEEQPTVDPPEKLICSVTVDTDEIMERIKERGWKPLEHGRWIEHHSVRGVYYSCSNCKAEGYGRYCQNCGAKMTYEEEE